MPDRSPTLPLPPPSLREYVGGTTLNDPEFEYLVIGALHKELLEDVLPDAWTWEGKRVLDFGCGSGRVLRHFDGVAGVAEFHGCDIDAECIDWASRDLSPPFAFEVNDPLPPLPYPGEHFDLIYGVSVFTHLTSSWADWMLEMHRVLKPGGRLYVTFLGRGIVPVMTDEPWDAAIYGANFAMIGNPWPEGGPAVYHSPWWIRAHWGRLFEVEDLRDLEGGEWPEHGVVLLRKDERPIPTREDLLKAEPNEPREISSLRKNVADLEREILIARGESEQLRAEVSGLRRANKELTHLATEGREPPLRPSIRTSWIRTKYRLKSALLRLKNRRARRSSPHS